MKVSYEWLQSFFDKKLPQPEKLADLLTSRVFETEAAQSNKGAILDIDVTPNRAHDCLSYCGIAREIGAILKIPFKEPDYQKKIKEVKGRTAQQMVKVEVREKDLCPRYTARVVEGVKVDSSPEWLQKRLRANGLRPISNIVDIANYVMLETGQPLHAFDYDKLKSKSKNQPIKKIIVRRANKGERIFTLDGEKYDLDEKTLVIADEEDPVCVAGIKGGSGPGIEKDTQTIVLEAANFNPQSIRNTSRRLQLATDASWRFENALDPNLTVQAIDMAVYLIQEIAGGGVLKGYCDFYPKKTKARQISLDLAYLENLLGISIKEQEIISILKRLGLTLEKKEKRLRVNIPTRRIDIENQEDLIEEIGRIHGFEKIPSQLPSASLVPPEINYQMIYCDKVKDYLSGYGYSEVYNYSFVSQRDILLSGFKEKELVELDNPISREQQYLRPSLVPNLLKNLTQNQKFFSQLRLFELGKVFCRENEAKHLSVVLSLGDNSEQANEFYSLKGALDAILERLGIVGVWYDDYEPNKPEFVEKIYHQNRWAQVKAGEILLGWLGQVNSALLGEYGVNSKAAVFEIDFNKLAKLATEQKEYLPPSRYPAVVRDLALVADLNTKVVQVMNIINRVGGKLVRDIDLFDVYQGDNLPNGRKSLAFHIIYQSDERTLTDQEINQLHQKVIDALEKEQGWEVRK